MHQRLGRVSSIATPNRLSRYGHLTVAGELGVVAPDELAAPNELAAHFFLTLPSMNTVWTAAASP
jgi:hypothetical protein